MTFLENILINLKKELKIKSYLYIRMIKITNLNFQNQTIQNIEVDGEDIHNVELKLTKTTFKIVLVKEGQTIKSKLKRKVLLMKLLM